MKKPLRKRWWAWTLVFLVIFATLSACSSEPKRTKSGQLISEIETASVEPFELKQNNEQDTETKSIDATSNSPEIVESAELEPKNEEKNEPVAIETEMESDSPQDTAEEIQKIESTVNPDDQPEVVEIPVSRSTERAYVLNTNTMKFHNPGCSSVKTISAKNKSEVTASRENLIAQGYDPCGKCNP